MKKWILFLVVTTVFTVQSAQAGFLLEPYAGTFVNTVDEDDNAVTGTSLGARVGFQNAGLMLGLDYQMATPTIEDNDSDMSITNYGVFIGYDFPIMLRVWATYVANGSYEIDDSGSYTKTSGTKIGIGYKAIPFLSINLEIQSLVFDEFELENGTELDGDSSINAYVLGVSFPLTI